ncbi:MAG: hypothetical protein EOM22_08815 [Gammaproteobacteria bacterium]|nr:hypothetical protein [Gammaproteobacteria bacterium]
MTCHYHETGDGLVAGYVCGPDHVVDLTPYGAHVWCEFHSHMGPSFFRSQNSTNQIKTPSRKTWRAFETWHKERIGD